MPAPGDTLIPRNFGRGPSSLTTRIGLSKTFGFGKESSTAPQNNRRVMEPHDREAFRVSVAWAVEGAAGKLLEAEVVVIEALAAGVVATRQGATV